MEGLVAYGSSSSSDEEESKKKPNAPQLKEKEVSKAPSVALPSVEELFGAGGGLTSASSLSTTPAASIPARPVKKSDLAVGKTKKESSQSKSTKRKGGLVPPHVRRGVANAVSEETALWTSTKKQKGNAKD